MIDAATNAYNQNEDLWNDNIATMQELKDNGYLTVPDNDPWGEPYDTTNSYVVVEAVVRHDENTIHLSTLT